MYHAERFRQRRPARCTIGVAGVAARLIEAWVIRLRNCLPANSNLEQEHVLDDAPVVPA
jgi:hypothetical protein